MSRLVIQNGTIIDGTGTSSYRGSVFIHDDVIEAIGPDLHQSLNIPCVDATDYIVSPGLIDTHSHSDFSLLVNPGADSSIYQGVTTEVIGNCGLTLFPVAETTKNLLKNYIIGLGYDDSSYPVDWLDLENYGAAFKKNGLGINIAPLVGHGSIRIAVMGFEAREATSLELDKMKVHLQNALDQGAWGMSSGLVYPPGINSPPHELEELCKITADRGALYTTHLRGDTLRAGPSFIESLDEALTAARRTGVRLHVSHASPKFPNTGATPKAIEKMQAARNEGFHVSCDTHPYLVAMTFLASLLPPWAFEGGTAKTLERFNNQAERASLVDNIHTVFSHLDAAEFWPLNEVVLPGADPAFNHMRIDTVAREMDIEPAEAMLEILARSGEKLFEVMVMQWIYSDEATRELLCWPHTTVGADGATSALDGDSGPLSLHPRSWGTFPKFIRDYCQKKGQFSLESLIYRMTGLPASVLGFSDRGTLAPGKKADIVVFSLDEFKDMATYTHPHQYAEGVKYVWVNGCLVLANGKRTSRRPGKMLRRQNPD